MTAQEWRKLQSLTWLAITDKSRKGTSKNSERSNVFDGSFADVHISSRKWCTAVGQESCRTMVLDLLRLSPYLPFGLGGTCTLMRLGLFNRSAKESIFIRIRDYQRIWKYTGCSGWVECCTYYASWTRADQIWCDVRRVSKRRQLARIPTLRYSNLRNPHVFIRPPAHTRTSTHIHNQIIATVLGLKISVVALKLLTVIKFTHQSCHHALSPRLSRTDTRTLVWTCSSIGAHSHLSA